VFLQFDILLKVVTTNTGLWDVTSHRLTATIQVSDERNACAFNVHWETEFFRSIVKSYQTTARYIPDNWYQRSHNHVPVSKYVLRNVVITRNCPQMELWSFSSKMWFMYGFSSSLEHVIYIYMCVCVCVCEIHLISTYWGCGYFMPIHTGSCNRSPIWKYKGIHDDMICCEVLKTLTG